MVVQDSLKLLQLLLQPHYLLLVHALLHYLEVNAFTDSI